MRKIILKTLVTVALSCIVAEMTIPTSEHVFAAQVSYQSESGSYLLPDSSTRYLTERDLRGMSVEELRIARNEIYARHGRKFTSADLNAYFSAQNWYTPLIEAAAFSDNMLSALEMKNVELIYAVEQRGGLPAETDFQVDYRTAKQKKGMLSTGYAWAVGVQTDGTVVVTDNGELGAGAVDEWGDIIAVDAGMYFVAGLKSDGTVVVTGSYIDYEALSAGATEQENYRKMFDVSGWSDIVEIAAGSNHLVGLKADGTVCVVGYRYNAGMQCDIDDWSDVVSISANAGNTVALKADGTVLVESNDAFGELGAREWTDIIEVSAGNIHIAGLKSDGTLVVTEYMSDYDMSGMTDLVSISAGAGYTLGLKSDGTVVAVGNNECGECNVGTWKEIVAIDGGDGYSLGLTANGKVMAAGTNVFGCCNASSWANIGGATKLNPDVAAYKKYFDSWFGDEDKVYLADVTHDGRDELLVMDLDYVGDSDSVFVTGYVFTISGDHIVNIYKNYGGSSHVSGFYEWYLVPCADGYNLAEEEVAMWQGFGSLCMEEYYINSSGNKVVVNSVSVSNKDQGAQDADGSVSEEAMNNYYTKVRSMMKNYYLLYDPSVKESNNRTLETSPKAVFAGY